MRSPMLRRSHHSTGMDRAMDQVTMIFIDEPYFLEDEHHFVRYFCVSNRVPFKTDPYPYLSSNYTAKIEIHQPKGRMKIYGTGHELRSIPSQLFWCSPGEEHFPSPPMPQVGRYPGCYGYFWMVLCIVFALSAGVQVSKVLWLGMKVRKTF